MKNKGFTLVELSIVLVIIGMIVAGVMAGQSLVKQARLRAIISEQESVKQAVNSFRLRYNGLPGDLSNAFLYWGTSCGADEASCNGDGDRQIEITGTNENAMEGYHFWQHLNAASMFPGAYTGVGNGSGAAADTGTINVNIPSSKNKGVGLTAIYEASGAQTAGALHTGNILIFGGHVASAIANSTEFSPTDVYSLDLKADDGNPGDGILLAIGSEGTVATDCVDTATDPDSYNLDSTDLTPCALAFSLD